MNAFKTYSDLLFTCVGAPQAGVVDAMLSAFNRPDKWNPEPSEDFFVKDTVHDLKLAYDRVAERDTTKPHRVLFWEPRIHPGKTVFMGAFHDGMNHTVYQLSADSPFPWINVRIYDDIEYPGCFLDYYANFRTTLRRIMACKDEEGWDFVQEGPIQQFETPDVYSRLAIADRLNRQIITGYMKRIGFSIAEDDFWETNKTAQFLWQERPSMHA